MKLNRRTKSERIAFLEGTMNALQVLGKQKFLKKAGLLMVEDLMAINKIWLENEHNDTPIQEKSNSRPKG